jgi:hypothetical protein
MIPLPHHPEPHTYAWTKLELEAIQKYGDARAAEERERCAKLCESLRHPDGWSCEHDQWVDGTNHCAAAIRAGGA